MVTEHMRAPIKVISDEKGAVARTINARVGVDGEFGIQHGQWADARYDLASGDPLITGDNIVGYFVEFSPVPNPVPLPGAVSLFATGLGVIGLLGWRRKRRQAAATRLASV